MKLVMLIIEIPEEVELTRELFTEYKSAREFGHKNFKNL